MMIVFKKSHVLNGKKRFVGSKTRVTERKGIELIGLDVAEIYSGEWPPKNKTKTNFFKPK
jgi:hypothetical protein